MVATVWFDVRARVYTVRVVGKGARVGSFWCDCEGEDWGFGVLLWETFRWVGLKNLPVRPEEAWPIYFPHTPTG